MWERVAPPDDRNRITLAMNSLLIRAAGKWILVETGAGDKWDAKRHGYLCLRGPAPAGTTRRARRPPEQIDIVVNTHLHFDHCGWNTRIVNGKAVPTFPNARYVVQRGELEHARHPTERDRASYFPENFEPMAEIGPVVAARRTIAKSLRASKLIRVPGHNRDMMCVRLTGGGKTVVFLRRSGPHRGASSHRLDHGLRSLPAEDAREQEEMDCRKSPREGWLAIFGHDAQVRRAAHLREQRAAKLIARAGRDRLTDALRHVRRIRSRRAD